LFEGGFKVVDDFLGENVGIGEIVGFFQAFVSEPENIEAGFVAVGKRSLVSFSGGVARTGTGIALFNIPLPE
jgi:hypothetical protein